MIRLHIICHLIMLNEEYIVLCTILLELYCWTTIKRSLPFEQILQILCNIYSHFVKEGKWTFAALCDVSIAV